MTYYQDPYGQRPPQGYIASDPLYSAKRRVQGWWGATAAMFVLGIILSVSYSATLVPSDNPYIHTASPTSLSYVLLAIGLINGVLGTAAFFVAIKATRDHGHVKRATYGRY